MTIASENMFERLSVGELPVGRRFQIQGRKRTFMRVDLTPYLEKMIDPNLDGTLVVNLDTGMVFCMQSNIPAL